eukprot:6201161-Pleurochrysis_carterae.AAC.8
MQARHAYVLLRSAHPIGFAFLATSVGYFLARTKRSARTRCTALATAAAAGLVLGAVVAAVAAVAKADADEGKYFCAPLESLLRSARRVRFHGS